jgi:dihydrolipoamide dehydrogenase
METLSTDAIVIGSGPGGYVAGIRIGQLGKKCIVVEREAVGGVCLNVGCIPSKALISAGKAYERARHNETMGISASDVKLDVARLQTWKGEVVGKLTGGVRQLLKSAGAQLLAGSATFVAPNRIEVASAERTVAVEAPHIVIATGSRPIAIPGFDLDGRRIIDSTGALSLGEIPPRLLVIGGGYIGLELGMMYAKVGSKVTVVEATGQLLPGNDPELVQVVQRKAKKMGIEVHLDAKALGWEEKSGAAQVRVQTRDGEQTIPADEVLVTVGRRPNSDTVGLDKIGVKVERGFVVVDKQQRTNVPGVYAIGDVCGQPMLAHKASREAEVVAEVITGHKAEMDAVAIPAVIFTDPEIATVGLMQHDAEKQGRKVKVGKFPFGALGRALAIAETDGFVKVIADAATDELLGLAVVGPEASDLISEGALALEMGAFLPDLALTVHPHPTLGEAVMEAAKAALGESPHLVGGGARTPAGAARAAMR